MKRFILALILLCIFVLTGCVSEDEKAYRQATDFLNQQEYFKAMRSFEQLAASGYKDSQELCWKCSLEIARDHMNNQLYESAILTLVELKENGYQPSEELLVDCYIRNGEYLASRHEYERAIDQFARAESINPAARTEMIQCYYDYGLYLFNNNDFVKAKEMLRIAIQEGHPFAEEQLLAINRQLLARAQNYMANDDYEYAYDILYPLLAQDQFDEATSLYEQCAESRIQQYRKQFNYQRAANIYWDMNALGYDGVQEAAMEMQLLGEAYTHFKRADLQNAYDALCLQKSSDEANRQMIHWALQSVDYPVRQNDAGMIDYGDRAYCYSVKTDHGYFVTLESEFSDQKGNSIYYLFFIGSDQQVKLLRDISLTSATPFGSPSCGADLYNIGQNGKGYRYGAVDGRGNVVIPCQYDGHLDFSQGYSIASLNGKYGIINPQGETILPFVYDHLLPCAEGLFPAQYQGKYGYIDLDGNVVLDFQYADAQAFSEGLAAVKKDYKWMYIDRQGNALCEAVWDALEPFSQGYGVVCRNGKYGYMRADGTLDGLVNLDFAGSYRNGLASFAYEYTPHSAGNEMYLRDLAGNVLCSAKYKYISTDEYAYLYGGHVVSRQKGVLLGSWNNAEAQGDGWYHVTTLSGAHGALHHERGLVIPCKWDYVRIFPEAGVAIVEDSRRYGLATLEDGSLIQQPAWRSFKFLGNDLFAYQDYSNGLWGFVNAKGEKLSEAHWNEVGTYAEGYIAVKENGDWGFVSAAGITAGPVIWDGVTFFSEGLAAVCMDDKWGYIDTQGKVVIPLQYKRANPFKNGFAYAGYGYIDPSGAQIMEYYPESLLGGFDEYGLAIMGKGSNNKYDFYGHFDRNGNQYGYNPKPISTYFSSIPSEEEIKQSALKKNPHLVWYFNPVKPLEIDGVLHLINPDGEILY
ncbi:MAG: hypothetical protein E7324_00970 [Clostridiales bacterium]|nr:hypothetical protein [Clostridiales bacterium]